MKTDKTSALIIYLSPHGTTRRAVEALSEALAENGLTADTLSLNAFSEARGMARLNAMIPSYPLIVFAAPTYFHHAPPVFMKFIRQIPEASSGQAAVILTTFGGVSSGVVQYDLAGILFSKKYRLTGGIQVLTEHCLTFQKASPFHAGRPNETDLAVIRKFGADIVARLRAADSPSFPPDSFKDKPPVLNFIDNYFNSLKTFAWAMPNVRIRREACTGCGLCLKTCPTGNITLATVAVHGKNCTYCYSCVRHCPSGAATAFLGPTAAVPKYLAGIFGRYETQTTRPVV